MHTSPSDKHAQSRHLPYTQKKHASLLQSLAEINYAVEWQNVFLDPLSLSFLSASLTPVSYCNPEINYSRRGVLVRVAGWIT